MAIELSSITFTNRADVVPASGVEQILNTGTANTLGGKDTITGVDNADYSVAIANFSILDTGDGNDTITGDHSIGSGYGIQNAFFSSIIDTGKGHDTITGMGSVGIYNDGTINTGDGNDTITGIHTEGGGIPITNYLSGIIDTGDGNDVITANSLGINNDGTINTGNGNDSIIAGFLSSNLLGKVFLGDGKDYLKGFGSGNFNGGNGKDTLELTSGSYVVGISGTAVNFTGYNYSGISIMNTSEFEKLIAGSTTYNFSSLTNGQTIVVA
ncbi:hypothetical protein [Microcoleus asticus]|uniref:Calcium-binding protein n=1 Tax=Microcoleus asticus IPMA8 TaxID=2563858 RepID=A0ABX2D3P7_9CYAN|nr:hypothetical protein [Microcoleus asticus]NQE37270.1 hypothetical protein [Microcoleus asticus IPMA8]